MSHGVAPQWSPSHGQIKTPWFGHLTSTATPCARSLCATLVAARQFRTGRSPPPDDRGRQEGPQGPRRVDIGDFPHLVSSNWQSIFARSMQSSDRSRLFLIRDARNDASHPGSGDMERDSVTARLTDIADVLRNIGASEEARAVQGIRDGLSGAASASAARAMPDPTRSRSRWRPSQRSGL